MLNLIIFGPPGAGKGTQANLLSKKYNIIHLSSGEILRQETKNGPLGEKIKYYQDNGLLVPDDLVVKIMESRVLTIKNTPGLILDGYPRNIKQASSLNKLFKNNLFPPPTIINIKLSEKTAGERILLRAKTSGRSDDNSETIRKRFLTYHQETLPILKYYQKTNKIIDINGEKNIENIFQELVKKIETLI